MSWQQLEYICKGIFLGLLVFIALEQPSPEYLELLLLCPLGGLALALGLAAAGKLREGYRVKGRLLPFALFLLLEGPTLTYAGILAGMTLAAFLVPKTVSEPWLMPATIVGGAFLGLGFGFVRRVEKHWPRSLLSLALLAAPAAAIGTWVYLHPGFTIPNRAVGLQLLFGLPFFYVLTLAGRAEETEVEIGAICVTLSLGMAIWRPFPSMGLTLVGLPVLLYFAYTTRYLPGIRVFKHTMRGLSYSTAGRYRQALQTFGRALELDPKNQRAREGLWSVHRSIDLVQAAQDPNLSNLINVDMCLKRAESLLIEARPTPEQLQEARTLLDFVLNQRPAQRPVVLYWRSVLHLKTGEVEQAAEELSGVVDPVGYPVGDPNREAILLKAWQLALTLHPEMQKRVGAPQLAVPGRRLEAIAAVERRLAETPEDRTAYDLKRLLYGDLTEAEYNSGKGPVSHFDHAYVLQLGLALIKDSSRWQRGAELLRIAARGLPAQGPSLYVQVARAADKAGDPDASWQNYRLAQEVGRAVGPKNLTDLDRQAYFATVKMLAEDAVARNDSDAAIESYQLYSENERSGLETLRTLAALYEKKGQAAADQQSVLNALRVTEQALVYNGSDKDLLDKKDRYYFSVMPETVKARLDTLSKYFDVAYCLRKAKSILDARYSDTDSEQSMLDWALHLAQLAQVVAPARVLAKVQEVRARLRRGERDRALWLLENLVHEQKPEKFADDDEEAWYLANRLLGDLYLNEVARPDLAIGCYTEYRKSAKSGADTLYKLGQSYEGVGDLARAKRYYEQVTAYEGHPLAYDARQALYRLQGEPKA